MAYALYCHHTARFAHNTGIQRCVRAIARALSDACECLTPLVRPDARSWQLAAVGGADQRPPPTEPGVAASLLCPEILMYCSVFGFGVISPFLVGSVQLLSHGLDDPSPVPIETLTEKSQAGVPSCVRSF